jgi:hypothetical protein
MALKLTRNAGTAVYGGWNLNPNSLNESYDHRLLVRSIIKRVGEVDSAIVHLTTRGKGVEQHMLFVGSDPLRVAEGVEVKLDNVGTYVVRNTPYCSECQRGGEDQRNIPQASFAFSAPSEYRIIRDDAVKKA